MKKTLILLLLLLPLAAWAQDRLQSGAVFEGKVVPRSRLVETMVKGAPLKDYGLSLFRSVRMDADGAELERITALILDDASGAISKETEIDRGMLKYALLALPPSSDSRCFLCFQSKPSDTEGLTSVIVVYMEGDTTLTDLRKMFTTK